MEQPWQRQGAAYSPSDLLGSTAVISRRSIAVDDLAEESQDPEEQVTEFDELVKAALRDLSRKTFKHAVPKVSEGQGGYEIVDLKKLGKTHRQIVVDRALRTTEQDNEEFLRKFEERVRRAGIELPAVEVRFEDVHVDTTVYVGDRALPSLTNSYRNMAEDFLIRLKVMKGNKRPFNILKGISGTLKPGRLTLLLGPPGAGKSTLLKLLAGKLQKDPDLKIRGKVSYNGETLDQFVPQRTAAYVDQVDLHIPDLTVRETFDFAARCQGSGFKPEFLRLLREKEKELGIQPDIDIDAFLKASAVEGHRSNPATEFIMRVLGLEICQDTFVGNDMIRGISGGQKKRVTSGEMVVGPKSTLFLDEISTGLDSSTTFLIVKCMRNFVHLQAGTVLIALLQPAPETYDLFDDILLLCEGHVVFHGPKDEVMPFFSSLGFQLPERKGIADFLQEVTSPKDQEQYWAGPKRDYKFVPVATFAEAFLETSIGKANVAALAEPVAKHLDERHGKGGKLDPLVRKRFALGPVDVFKACMRREWTLMNRHSFLYIFRTFQTALMAFISATLFIRPRMHHNTVADGNLYAGLAFYSLTHMFFDGFTEMALTIDMLPVFFKQRDNFFYPAWAFSLPTTLLRIPYSIVESFTFSIIVYFVVGFSGNAGRFFTFWLLLFLCHALAVGLFRLMGAIGRNLVVAYTIAWVMFLLIIMLSGYVLVKGSIHSWYIGGYWALPYQYLVNSIMINEFTSGRWNKPYMYETSQNLGEVILSSHDWRHTRAWVWYGVAVVGAWIIMLNVLIMIAMKILNPIDKQTAMMGEDELTLKEHNRVGRSDNDSMAGKDIEKPASGELDPHDAEAPGDGTASLKSSKAISRKGTGLASIKMKGPEKGMVLPFDPLNLVFSHIFYSVDLPAGYSVPEGAPTEGGKVQLELLKDINGAFRPGILTCLMGTSGAGKTTLMDCLAGRKTSGTIKGDILVNGFPKVQASFARVSGYVEQFDIHSPAATVVEALRFSADLRLMGITPAQVEEYVDEVLDLMELTPQRHALVGLPGVTGLSVEQRKRLTIGVELVGNPSVVFMDEPTSGLDARAAAIVMRTVRNIVDTGRTVVCTIHQPSIDIFEAFDELLLLKRGGRVTYSGPTGHNSEQLVAYFETVPGVPALGEGINPATWMLEISTVSAEEKLGKDFADIYASSNLARENERLIKELSVPAPDAKPIHFDSVYARSQLDQFRLILKKNFTTYWRTPQYNAVRMVFTVIFAFIIGSIYWRLGSVNERTSITGIQNVLGALLIAAIFLGTSNASTVQPVVDTERTVFYRERAAGMYSAYPFALAQALVEIPYLVVQTIMYSCITYFMIYFEINAAKFFWYLLFMYLTLAFFTFYGMLAVAVSPNVQMAAILSSFNYSAWFLFAGFIIPKPSIPGWYIWLYYIDPLTYTVYGLIASQLGDVDYQSLTLEDGQSVTVAQFVTQNYGYKHDFLGYAVLVLCGFIMIFHAVTAFALKKFNFQKR